MASEGDIWSETHLKSDVTNVMPGYYCSKPSSLWLPKGTSGVKLAWNLISQMLCPVTIALSLASSLWLSKGDIWSVTHLKSDMTNMLCPVTAIIIITRAHRAHTPRAWARHHQGVWGHAPPENFEDYKCPEVCCGAFWKVLKPGTKYK